MQQKVSTTMIARIQHFFILASALAVIYLVPIRTPSYAGMDLFYPLLLIVAV